MGNFWLKLKVWTKSLLFAVVSIYALLFVYNNSGQEVTFWYWFGRNPKMNALVMMGVSLLAGVLVTILIRTTFTTIRQIRELRQRGRLERLEREAADMKAKAAMLQTRTQASPNDQASMTNE
jgi:hypothetical protein